MHISRFQYSPFGVSFFLKITQVDGKYTLIIKNFKITLVFLKHYIKTYILLFFNKKTNMESTLKNKLQNISIESLHTSVENNPQAQAIIQKTFLWM